MRNTLRTFLLGGCVSAAMVLSGASAAAASVHECVSAKPTAASYTWNFKGEANTIFLDLRSDADQALNHADQLQSFQLSPGLSWEAYAGQLDQLKENVNDIGAQLCRLETIRRVVSPWQQKEIDRIVTETRLMADNTQDAILFLDAHRNETWMPAFQKYTNNLFDESQSLSNSVRDAVSYANVSKEYRNLRHEMNMRRPS